MAIKDVILKQAVAAKNASLRLGLTSTEVKNKALMEMAEALEKNTGRIIAENRKDLRNAQRGNHSKAFIDRLTLDERRIRKMASCLREVAALPDPVGEVAESWTRPNGLLIQRVRAPLGVIGIIYESRPDVTSDAVGICVKSGNAVILRGGSEALNSNIILSRILAEAAYNAGIPEGSIQIISSKDRKAVEVMLKLRGYVDVIIPRGGAGLINFVAGNSSVPVIETGVGNCHAYVDSEADLNMAYRIVFNAKCQRPGVCNAIETLLVHEKIAEKFLPEMSRRLIAAGVELRGCPKTRKIVPEAKKAVEADWRTEYLDLILAVKIVDSLDEAVRHINKYGSKHSETIITKNKKNAEKFLREVDAAAVYWNASTRFTDGNQFGLGAEIGISTQKIHARGPMSVRELTSTRFVVYGNGQVRE